MRTAILAFCLLVPSIALAQNPGPGQQGFVSRCAGCHGSDGNGGELGPAIIDRVPARTDEDLAALFKQGLPAAGMPAFPNLTATESADLIRYVRTLRRREGSGPVRTKLTLADGSAIEGLVLNQSALDLQLLGDDRKIHLLRKSGERYRAVTSQADWPSYNGQTTGNRYSTLAQITTGNVSRMVPEVDLHPAEHVAPAGDAGRRRRRHVCDGRERVLRARRGQRAARSGTTSRPRTKGLVGNAAGGINRGVAVAGDRVFMVTDHAHLIALNRFTGALLWETEMADWRQNYNATGAPLVVGNLVVTGTSGGDEGVRGFVAAYDQATGKEVWRFWTVPRPANRGRKPGRARASSIRAPRRG